MTMTQRFLTFTIASLLALPTLSSAQGKGGGGGGNQTDSGKAAVDITFRDCSDGLTSSFFAAQSGEGACSSTDRLASENGTPYADGLENVEAYVGSKANSGNIWLKVAQSTRRLTVDFTDCAAAPCKPPFQVEDWDKAILKVDVDAAVKSGVYGMKVGDAVKAPMIVWLYWINPGDSAPAMLNFNPALSGKTPCKNKSDYVTVLRTSSSSWEVIADPNTIACLGMPDGSSAGTFRMPFRFLVRKQ